MISPKSVVGRNRWILNKKMVKKSGNRVTFGCLIWYKTYYLYYLNFGPFTACFVLHRFVEVVIDPQTANGWTQNDSGGAELLKFLLWKNDNGWQSASNGYKIRNWWDNKINKLLWKGLVQNKCALQREDSMRKDSISKDSMTDHRLRDLRKQVLEPALEHCASWHSFIKGQGSIT